MDARVADRVALVSPWRQASVASRSALAALLAWAVAAAGAPAVGALESAYPVAPDLTAWIAVGALYIALFATTTAAFAIWLAPGWLASRIVRPDDDIAVRALRTAILSLALIPLLHALVLAVIGPDAQAPRYRLASGVALVACVAALRFLEVRRQGIDSSASPAWRPLALSLVFAGVLLAVLLPRIIWQDFNPDGLELYTMGRTLASHVIARLPTGELPGENLGMLTVAYPIDWLQQTMGLREASARLPVLLYLVGAYLGVVALAERGATRRLTTFEHVLVMAGIAGFGLALAWNSSYDPYSTDMASPASIDLLAMVLLLAIAYFLFAGERAWCIASAAAMSLTRPSALLLCGLLALAILLVERWRGVPTLVTAACATVACVAASLLYTHVLGPLLHAPIGESGGQLLGRLRYLRFDDWSRLAWLVVPSGVVPVLAFARWRQHDAQSRILLLVTLGYFGFFYMLAFVALHHFAPAMLLPLAVFWHTRARAHATSGREGMLIAAGALLAVAAAWPRSNAPFRDVRRLAGELRYDVGDYKGRYAQMRQAFDSKFLLDTLFAPYWAVEDPARERVGAPWALVHYASTAPSAATVPNYVVQGITAPPPAGMTRVATSDSAALFVRDVGRWRQERSTPPPPDPRSRIYDVPRPTLFSQWGLKQGVPQVDLRKLLTGSAKPRR